MQALTSLSAISRRGRSRPCNSPADAAHHRQAGHFRSPAINSSAVISKPKSARIGQSIVFQGTYRTRLNFCDVLRSDSRHLRQSPLAQSQLPPPCAYAPSTQICHLTHTTTARNTAINSRQRHDRNKKPPPSQGGQRLLRDYLGRNFINATEEVRGSRARAAQAMPRPPPRGGAQRLRGS